MGALGRNLTESDNRTLITPKLVRHRCCVHVLMLSFIVMLYADHFTRLCAENRFLTSSTLFSDRIHYSNCFVQASLSFRVGEAVAYLDSSQEIRRLGIIVRKVFDGVNAADRFEVQVWHSTFAYSVTGGVCSHLCML